MVGGLFRPQAVALWAAILALILPGAAQAGAIIGTAPFVSPASAGSYYGASTTSTNGTGEATRPKEVQELARALKGDVDLIYEHVRNNTTTVWTFGLSKGAMGVIVDRAGTSFDQAHLMVELLRQSGKTASYKLGAITLTGAQFEAWTGITSAKAACQLLSSGGIPGVINGATTSDCNYGAATVSSIQLAHVWVATTINGTEYLFDPAYKPHSFKAGLNLATATGMSAGDLMASVSSTSGSQSGITYETSFSAATLTSKLQTYTTTLGSALASSAPSAGLDDVVGGQTITPQAIPAGGLRQTTLPYTAVASQTITGNIPDQYRIRMRIVLTQQNAGTPVDSAVYIDEIYGRRLVFDPTFDTTGASFQARFKLIDELGAVTPLFSQINNARPPADSQGALQLIVNMPYAAGGGTYMDRNFNRTVLYHTPFVVLHGWGDTGRGLVDKWGARKDSAMPAYDGAGSGLDYGYYRPTKADGRRELLAASFLAQISKAARLHAAIGKGVYSQHYLVGVVYGDTTVQSNTVGKYWITDNADRMDFDVGFSLTSKSATSLDRRAAIHATADTIAALTGSVQAQVLDLPDVSSVASRFEWGNAPEAAMDPSGAGSRRVYKYNNLTDAGQALGLSKTEGATTTANDGIHPDGQTPEIGASETLVRRQALADTVSLFTTYGFSVVASEEAFLGPGARGGAYATASGGYTHAQSRQRGGALIAYRYDGGGDPLEIAHVLTGGANQSGRNEGGAGGAQLYHQTQYDPATAADVVQGRWISSPAGTIAITSPAKVTAGRGAFPYGLTGELIWRGDQARDETYGPLDHHGPQPGWTTNFNNSLTISGSGLAVMDASDARASVGTVAAFYAAQDLYRASPSSRREVLGQLVQAWWTHTLEGNVATVSLGPSTRQFLKKPDGSWFAPGAGDYTTLTQTGARTLDTRLACYSSGRYIPTRGWSYAGVSFQVKGPQGDIRTFQPWSQDFNPSGTICGTQRGFRLTTWTWPKGAELTFSYASPATGHTPKLASVANNQNQRLDFIDGGLGGFRNYLSTVHQVTVAQPAGQPASHTDAVGAVTKFEITPLGSGEFQRSRLTRIYAADDGVNPSRQYIYDSLARLKESKDKFALAGSRASAQFLLADGLRSETVDPLGHAAVVYTSVDGRSVRALNALGAQEASAYDGRRRLIVATASDGDRSELEYNPRNQLTKQTRYPTPGSPEVGQTLVTETGWDAAWNLPAWTKDARGAQTDYVYSQGELQTTTYPAAAVGETRYTEAAYYYASGLAMSLDRVMGQNLALTYSNVSVSSLTDTVGDQSGAYSISNNAVGDPTRLQRPRGGQIDITYDLLRRATLQIGPQVGSAPRDARRTTYDLLGRVTKLERGTYAGSTFAPLETYAAEYDAVGNKVKDISPARIVQYGYDALDRVVCTAVRMNPAVYDALPADACAPGAPGAQGPDRISRATYDAVGQKVLTEIGVGTDVQQVTARYTFSPGGRKTTLTDANGNRSTFEYDGFGRLAKIRYPAAPRALGVSSATDYEAYTYDASGNVLTRRKRSGAVIAYTYDALNRVTVKDLPNTTAGDAYYRYQSNGRHVQARLGSPTATEYVYFNFDQAGRLVVDAGNQGGAINQYDSEGLRISAQTGGGLKAHFTYDLAGRLTDIKYTTGVVTSPTPIASIAYGALGRPRTVTRPNGISTNYVFDGAGRLTGLTHSGDSPTAGSYQTFRYNPLGQLTDQTQASSQFIWSGQPTATTNFTHDALNRDAAVATASGYDADGNLISDGTRTFGYDSENRLISVTGGPAPVTLSYDPFGRLTQVASGGAGTVFWYNGAAIVEERDLGLGLLRSYVHGLGADDPVAWFEGGGNDPGVSFFHKDRLGSVIAVSTPGGTITPYTYGPYGEPQSWSGSRFRYTGQIAIPEAQLYHYKARAYDPMRGHFLQTDPIGYGDGPNLYAYVKGDPLNATDPSGQNGFTCFNTIPGRPDLPGPTVVNCGGGGGGFDGFDNSMEIPPSYGMEPHFDFSDGISLAGIGADVNWLADMLDGLEELGIQAENNRQIGAIGEMAIRQKLMEEKVTIVAEQVYIKTSKGMRIVDFIVMDQAGQIHGIEAKANTATRSLAQLEKDSLIASEGGTVRTVFGIPGYSYDSLIKFDTWEANVTVRSETGIPLVDFLIKEIF